MNLSQRKKELRAAVKEAGAILTEEFLRFSDEAVRRNLMSLAEYRNATCVFLFVGMPHLREIDTKPLMEDLLSRGRTVAVPRCTGAGQMEICAIRSRKDFTSGLYGIPEPKKTCRAVGVDEIDFAVVPCLSCDRIGNRLGRGGGYYDRFLKRYSGSKAMIVRECLMNSRIPMEKHDAAVLPVVTDRHIYYARSAAMPAF